MKTGGFFYRSVDRVGERRLRIGVSLLRMACVEPCTIPVGFLFARCDLWTIPVQCPSAICFSVFARRWRDFEYAQAAERRCRMLSLLVAGCFRLGKALFGCEGVGTATFYIEWRREYVSWRSRRFCLGWIKGIFRRKRLRDFVFRQIRFIFVQTVALRLRIRFRPVSGLGGSVVR